MTTVPTRFAGVILSFAELFRQRTWRLAEQMLIGAILAPGVRTVASVLRVLGLSGERHFVNYHRVLSRAVWSPRAAARVLLELLVRAFVPQGPIVLGIDDTGRCAGAVRASPRWASTATRCAPRAASWSRPAAC